MVFHSCGICDREYGLHTMHDIESMRARIAFSGITRLFEELVAPLADPAATGGARAYAAAAKSELDGGLRRGASHVCAECCKQLPQSDSAMASYVVPKLALVNGYFRGACPPELEGLSLVDISLICPINIISSLAMFDHGHYQSSATVFSVLNDVVDIAPKLPRSTSVGIVCTVIRPNSVQSPKPLRYNPNRVLKALTWLKANNHLYADINIEPTVNDTEPPTAESGVWRNGGRDADCELPFISASAEDFEGITEAAMESPAGDDGHPVNPGAPSSDTEKVYLYTPEPQDTRQVLAAIANPNSAPAVVLVRHNGEYVTDYNTEHFLQRAFPHLFPYGRGGPGTSPALTFSPSYIANMLLLGHSRSFQQCPRFIFYAYTWVMRKKVGTIAHLAESRGQHGITAFTVAEAKQMLSDLRTTDDPHAPLGMSQAKLWSIVRKLQPYAQTVPGTELYFAQERRKLMAMISSPATITSGQWTWFFTEAQADMHLAEIYDNAVTSFPATRAAAADLTWPARQAYCSNLSAELRESILRAHPFMSARVHALQQEAYWANVLQGENQPLGEITDYWLRAEFQMKGTPHWHSLINISKASMPGVNEHTAQSDSAEERRRVELVVERVATAKLVGRAESDDSDLRDDATRAFRKQQELEWNYNVDRKTYFADSTAPARERFSAERDYSVNSATGEFADLQVQQLYRRLQLANQMHKCRKSCYKYCRSNQRQLCRYGFVKEPVEGNDARAVVVADKDRRGRTRTRVLPPRNNGNINNHLKDPLCFTAGKGNQDIQYIQNTTGGAEYCSKYCSKADAVETTALQNAVNRKLARYVMQLPENEQVTARWQFRAVGNAIVAAQQIGTVQACYMLGKLPIVKSSRSTEFVNCLKRNELTVRTVITEEDVLDELLDEESALSNSPSTQHGKRDAYHELCMQQMGTYGVVHISFYAFLSAYTLAAITPRSPAPKVHEGCKLLTIGDDGYIVKPVTFKIGKVGASGRCTAILAVMCVRMPQPG
jgi:hypothetical protein